MFVPAIHTSHEALDALLEQWRKGVLDILGDDTVGIYLQGSFAVGDADANSDCDFMVVTRRDVASERTELDALHLSLHALPYVPWRHRLEGSYAPADILRRCSMTPRDPPDEPPRAATWADPGLSGLPPRVYPFLYLDHGAKTLVRSEHDNSQVVRWALREKGMVLFGPVPTKLIDPVSPAALRSEVLELLSRIAACQLHPFDLRYWHAFWVGLLCRISHTAATGSVVSKKAATEWAADTFDQSWRPLIERAQAIRDGKRADAMVSSSAEERRATLAFAAEVFAVHGVPWPFADNALAGTEHGPAPRTLSR